jgi:K+-transporting ATPase KdpF subunit
MVAACYDRPDLHRHHRGLLCGQRSLRLFLRETLIMENLIVGGISVLLFLYLVVAMLRPEKF